MGIAQKTLQIIPSELDSMLSNSIIDSEHLDNLCTQITRIHRHVSMKVSIVLDVFRNGFLNKHNLSTSLVLG
jgi:hypothetical protein